MSRLSISFCLSFGDIYLSLVISLGISLPLSFVTVSELCCCEKNLHSFLIFYYYTILVLVYQ